jgi:hypothetical protein
MNFFSLTLVIICLFSAGCRPPEANIAEQSSQDPAKEAHLAPILSEQSSEETLRFTLLTRPWSKYLSVPPKIYTFDNISSGIEKLLATEQKLIQAVLEADVDVAETSAYSTLNDRLDELKAAAPSAETSSGYVRSSSSGYRRTYISGDTIYTHSYPYYNGYSVFRAKQKSSSPELVRSVSGLAANATLTVEDLDQRITALQHLSSTWSRRTSTMSTNGTAGIMRDANEDYLEGLRQYTSDFIQLRKELRTIRSEQSKKAANKSNIIKNWNQFEQQNLHILNKFFQDNHTAIIEPTKGADYLINKDKLNGTLILVCNIGPRQLYFELNGRNPFHPFTLADITPTLQ